mgnify:CR=1 FL=1
MSYITFEEVRKTYHVGEIDIHALDGVNFEVEKGQVVIVAGASGAGKSTILNILGGMDTITSGKVIVDGKHVDAMNEKELTDYRRFDIGFVFQFYNLVQNLTALENVELASEICKDPLNPVTVLEQVGLQDRMHNFPAQLSGGEQQRVAIARAIAKNPKLLLCDEPTSALDVKSAYEMIRQLKRLKEENGMTMVVITHNIALAVQLCDRIAVMYQGDIVEVQETKTLIENPMHAYTKQLLAALPKTEDLWND